jgi:hypothetical protein
LFDLAVIREGLKANLDPVGQLLGLQVTAYMLASPMAPFIEIMGPDEITYDIAMQRGGDSTIMIVRAFVSASLDQGAQINLDKMLASSGESSVKEAIESDTTLGGAVDDLRVTRCSGYRLYRPDTGPLLGAQWFTQIETYK